jgi:hypothetical protein
MTTVVTGAISPDQITHAFSLNGGHLSWSMLTGKKRIENRNFKLKKGWYAVGLTKLARVGVAEDKEFRDKFPDYPGFQAFEDLKGCLVGAVYVSHSLPHAACANDFFACANYKIKNIITKTIDLDVAIPCRGNLGTWPICEQAKEQFQQAVRDHLNAGKPITETGAEQTFPRDVAWETNSKSAYEDAGVPAKPAKTSKQPKPSKQAVKKFKTQAPALIPKKAIEKKVVELKTNPVVAKAVVKAVSSDIRSFFAK